MKYTKEYIEKIFYHIDGIVKWRFDRGSKIKAHMNCGTINRGRLRVLFDGHRLYNHQIVFLIENGYLPKNIDHRDVDPLNNHPSNLRDTTHAQNCANRRKRSDNKSGYKGVSFHKVTGKYQAELCVNGVTIYLGLYITPEIAAHVYNEAALKHHGEYANINQNI